MQRWCLSALFGSWEGAQIGLTGPFSRQLPCRLLQVIYVVIANGRCVAFARADAVPGPQLDKRVNIRNFSIFAASQFSSGTAVVSTLSPMEWQQALLFKGLRDVISSR
jgi:hypothetical protein